MCSKKLFSFLNLTLMYLTSILCGRHKATSVFLSQIYRSSGADGSSGRGQKIHLQLWDTAGQERCVGFFCHVPVLWSSLILRSFLTSAVSPRCLQVSEPDDCVLQGRHGLPPPVRPHKRTEFPQRQKLDEYVSACFKTVDCCNEFILFLPKGDDKMRQSGFHLVFFKLAPWQPGCEILKCLFLTVMWTV